VRQFFKKLKLKRLRSKYSVGSIHERFVACDVKRTVEVISADEINQGWITVRAKTANVLYEMGGLTEPPDFGEGQRIKLKDIWVWTGASWGGLEDGTSLVGTHLINGDKE